MKTATNQNNMRKSLITSTPISEKVVSTFIPSLKPINVVKPNHRRKRSVYSYNDFLGVKKLSRAKEFNLPCSHHQDSSDIVSCKENFITLSNSVSNSFTKCDSRRSKTSALKPLNTFIKCDKISDISPIYPESRLGKRFRSSNKNSSLDLNKDIISLNKSKNQNSVSGDAKLFSRMPLDICNRPSSPFLSARNDYEVKGANLKVDNISINPDMILKNSHSDRKKRSSLNENTCGAMPRPSSSSSSIFKKVRFSDKIELLGGRTLPQNNLNFGNTPIKKDKTELDPYGIKELLEFLEDKGTLVNKKDSGMSSQQMKITKTNTISRNKESEKSFQKKITKDGGVSKRNKSSQVKRIKLKNSKGNFRRVKDSANNKTRKNFHSKNNKSVQRTVDEKESTDWDINISPSLEIDENSKLSSTAENKAMNTELHKEEAHLTLYRPVQMTAANKTSINRRPVGKVLTNEEVIYENTLNGAKGSRKNDTICIEDIANNNKYEERNVENENNLLITQTKGLIIGKNGECKQKEEEAIPRDLEETILYPSTSTPFDSPQRETKELSLNFQCLSPILENQQEIISNAFYDYEPSVVCAERTYGKCTLKSISKQEKLWSLITTSSSIDTTAETFSATTSTKEPEKEEENAQDILLFETPPLKMLSGESVGSKKQRKEGKKIQEKSLTKHTAGKRSERKSENKTKIRKMESSNESSTQQSQLSKHFEDVFAWNLYIERKEPKMEFSTKDSK